MSQEALVAFASSKVCASCTSVYCTDHASRVDAKLAICNSFSVFPSPRERFECLLSISDSRERLSEGFF